ncbi:MAG TPA: IS481 family transposase, partial [Thermoanaerobaculia bacterium]|nr:IS481 family transposase [Thermoanaerobaculia bacterium]
RSSRPHTVEVTEQATRDRILALRREWWTVRQIALAVSVSASTVARVCRAAGLSRLRHLEAPKAPVRYERERSGELLHVDIKRLGRFDRVGHRITRKRSYGSKKHGFEYVYVATDDFTRLCYVDILADERSETASTFLKNAVNWFAQQNVTVERVMTDNGSAFIAREFAKTCAGLNVRHKRTRPYTPRTNGKAERFIQTLLREWAYRFAYDSSDERKRWLPPYLHFYNHHRAHSALAYNPPVSRLDENNVLRRNS